MFKALFDWLSGRPRPAPQRLAPAAGPADFEQPNPNAPLRDTTASEDAAPGDGTFLCREAVLGSNTVITGSTHIIDVTGPEPVTYKGYVPPRSVVVPGSYRKQFPAGEYSVTCALIIGRRKESTDKKTSLYDALRVFAAKLRLVQ